MWGADILVISQVFGLSQMFLGLVKLVSVLLHNPETCETELIFVLHDFDKRQGRKNALCFT